MESRTILHSDINSCYASIELLHHPKLRGKPVAVGGNPENRHGIVLTADYIAKGFGVKTGMPLWQARQLCPEITFLPPRMELYLRFSKMAQEIYSEYTDLQQAFGIDESWLDVTASCSIKGEGKSIADEIRQRMKKELGITVSIGVSWNKIFAKLGSDYKKPDAITEINKDNYKYIAWNLPVKDLLYVGKSTNRKLNVLGIRTIGELANTVPEVLKGQLGKMGLILHSFANGWDDSPVRQESYENNLKSVGNSTTTPRDLKTNRDIKIVINILSESVGTRLRENGFKCQGVELSVRDNELFCFSRQRKLKNSTNITNEIAEAAYQLFKENYNWDKPIRSIGVRGIDLIENCICEQLDLFSEEKLRTKLMKTDKMVDSIRERFGFYSIQRGVMLQDKGLSSLNAKEEHIVHPHGYFE